MTQTLTVEDLTALLNRSIEEGKIKASDEVWLSNDPSGSVFSPVVVLNETEYNIDFEEEGKVVFYPPS